MWGSVAQGILLLQEGEPGNTDIASSGTTVSLPCPHWVWNCNQLSKRTLKALDQYWDWKIEALNDFYLWEQVYLLMMTEENTADNRVEIHALLFLVSPT